MNENGAMFVDFCMENNLIIGGSFFQHKEIHKITWESPDKKTMNQIDHIMIKKKWRRALEDVRVMRGADIVSDHFLVRATLKI
jgi:endonuclease/exonuclease/phosphatase family metal-dependent hydrolase